MCGIAGLIRTHNDAVSLQEAGNRMLSALRHRGPDSQGTWSDEKAGLLLTHNRLAIQDLSEHGHQPMRSPSGRYCIIFNGEIYNFRELARELQSLDYHFTGHSDTEVLLCAIEEWGLEGALQRITGMFALALWDKIDRMLTLCRDRLGEKPLYYGWIGDCFYFASELKAIEAVASRGKLHLDQRGLTNYLRYGYIPAPYSIYKNVYKLPPGTIFACQPDKIFDRSHFSPCPDNSGFGPKTYWSVLDVANAGLKNLIQSEEEAIEALDTLLNKTIRMQKIADVGVGVFLSGGIDSSTVAAITQSVSSEKINTYSIGFSEKEFDESMHAERIARHLNTNHSTISVSSRDTLDIVPDIASIFDEPFADSSQIPTYLVSRFARSKVTVCLSGDGGDELFAGYNRYLSTDSIWKKMRHIPYPLRNALASALGTPPPGFWDRLYRSLNPDWLSGNKSRKLVGLKLQKLAGLMKQKDLMEGYDYLLSYWNNPEGLLNLDGTNTDACPAPEYPSTDNFINKAMYLDQIGYLQGDNLAKVDRASMAVSLETRLPLLSHELVELSWRIPVSMKVRANQSKWILRQVLYKYVPHELIERPKMGFSVPVAAWLRGDLRSWAEDMLCLVGSNGYDFLDDQMIRSAWKEHLDGKCDHSQRLWTILMLLSWLKSHEHGSGQVSAA